MKFKGSLIALTLLGLLLTLLWANISLATEGTPSAVVVSQSNPSPASPQWTVEEQAVIDAYLKSFRARKPSGVTGDMQVTKVAVAGDYALLSWLLEPGGGNCVLAKRNGNWEIVRGTGGAYGYHNLVMLGVPPQAAADLIRQVSPAFSHQIPTGL